ncbi:hypothetical protein GCM10027161_01190 [Microbispora hainanensis]
MEGQEGGAPGMREEDRRRLRDDRAWHPERVAHAAAVRRRRPPVSGRGPLLIIAADRPARGVLGVAVDAAVTLLEST